MRVRRIGAVGTALALIIGLIAAVTIVRASHPGLPRQVTGTAAGQSHRVSASATIGQIVNGRFVPEAQAASRASGASGAGTANGRSFMGPVARVNAKPLPGAVPLPARPKPIKFPVRGKTPPEKVVPATPVLPAKKAGYDPKTSREVPPARADQVVYDNADGTHTAFTFENPVNYLQPNGQWATINPALVPAGSASTPAPSASVSPSVPESPSASATATATFVQELIGDPSSTASPDVPTPGVAGPATSTGASPSASYVTAPPSVTVPSSPAATPGAPPVPSASASGTPVPSTGPSSAAPSTSTTPPSAGWTQQSEAEPESFAPYASAADLVTMPVDASHSVAFGIAGAIAVPGSAQGNTVSYAGAQPGSTIEFSAGTGLVKEQIVLASSSAPATWVFPLSLTGLTAQQGADGAIEFTDVTGKVVAYVPHGSMADANIDPHSGDGAMSDGVTYSLTTYQGTPAIQMTLDASWLNDPARVYPVTVDPTLVNVSNKVTGATASTYVEYPNTSDNSSAAELRVGTYDGGGHKAEAYLTFGNVGSASSGLQNVTVLGANLGIYDTWSYSCEPSPVSVYAVTSQWTPSSAQAWSGRPSTGAEVGQASFAAGWMPQGSGTSPCPSSWESIDLNQAGTDLINGWTHGAANNGLALAASGTDSNGWKKLVSYSGAQSIGGTGNPFLAITYTPDGASYQLAKRPIVTPMVVPQGGNTAQNAVIKVTVKNTGSTTWTSSNGYQLSYDAYESNQPVQKLYPTYKAAFTPIPAGTTVAPGGSVTLNATINAFPNYGAYSINIGMYQGATGSSPVSFSSEGIQPYAFGLNIPQPPTVSSVYPPTGYVSPTLAPQLSTSATVAGSGTLTYSYTVTCEPVAGQTCVASTITSSGSKPYWTIPRAKMQWNTSYQWSVVVTSSTGGSTPVGPISLTTEVPQPGITSGLGGGSSQAYDPLSGNFTTSATDAPVATAGPPLKIGRTYNSMDPRITGAFGAGWSTLIDAAVRPDNDGTGDVTVTTPDGQEIRFGANGDGSYAPPFGSTDVLVQNVDGTWQFKDASGNVYAFTSTASTATGQLSEITDTNGLTESFTPTTGPITTITNNVSGRLLTLTWGSTGGTSQHVTSVTTQDPGTGPLAWTYNYQGDQLTSVCAPALAATGGCTPTCVPATGCTQYSYTSGSEYRAAVLDSSPRSYWQLGDPSGSSPAADEVDVNLGTTDGTYNSNVTLGQDPGPLAGSTETAATFNGTNSALTLPASLMTDSTDVTVGLWFKAASPTASGVLFGYAADPLTSSSGSSDNHDPALYVGTDGYLHGELWNGSVHPISSTVNVDDQNWHYAVLTGSGSSQSLYLDGAQVGTSLSGQIDQLNMSNDTVGAGFWGGSWPAIGSTSVGYFNGDIAQVAVYPHPLGLGAIAQQYALRASTTAEMTQVTRPSGVVSQQAQYDPGTDRLTSYTDPNGGTWTISAPATSGLKATSDALGQVQDRVTVSGPEGRQEAYDYDMLNGGRLISFSNNGDTQSYVYDADGYVTQQFSADGSMTCLTNDPQGNVLSRSWYPNQPPAVPAFGGTGTAPTCTVNTSPGVNCWSNGNPCTSYYTYNPYDTANPLDPDNNKMLTSSDGRSASSTDTTYQTTYTYNAAGQVLTQTTPATSDFPSGRTTTNTYTDGIHQAAVGGGTAPAGLLLSKSVPGYTTGSSLVTTYQYYSNGDLARVNEPTGLYRVYTYDALGSAKTSTVYADSNPGQVTSYSYNAMGLPVMVTYPGVYNQVAKVTHTLQDSYAYDPDGDVLSLTQSDTTGGANADPTRVTRYTYDDHDRVVTKVEPAGATSGGTNQSGTNDAFGSSSATPDGATTSYSYDDFGNVTKRVDPNRNEYDYTYNEYNKPTQETLHTNSASQANPTPNCTAPATQDSTGCDLVLYSWAYDPAGLLAAITDAMGRITNYYYDNDQEQLAVTETDPCSASGDPTCPATGTSVARQTSYQYDGAGNRTGQTVTNLIGGSAVVAGTTSTTTDYNFDAASRLTSVITDPTPAPDPKTGYGQDGYANRSVSYTYLPNGVVKSQTTGGPTAGGQTVTAYSYNANGTQETQTVGNGTTTLATTTWTYNQGGKPLTMVAPDGNVSGGTPANYTTTYTYDPVGDLISKATPSVSTQSYGAQTPATTTPTTYYGYDTFGDQAQVQDPGLNVTTTAYDGDGRVTTVTQPSYTQASTSTLITPVTKYGYDGDGNVTQVTDADQNVTSYTYNALGDVTSTTPPQVTSTLPQASAQCPQPGSWTYTYDADGEQLSATDPLCNTTQATYDYYGEQATSTDAIGTATGSTGHTTQYAYDYLGDVVKVTSPDLVVTTAVYDHLGEMTSTADAAGDASSFEYGYAGQLKDAFSPDGGFTQYGYDAAGRLTSEADFPPAPAGQSAAPLRSESFGYDAAGNRTSATDWNGNTTTYAYNAAGELTSQVVPASASQSITTSYGYDAAGNRTSVTGGQGNTTWTTYNPLNLPESVVEPATTAGQPASQRMWTTSYDGNGNPVAVSQPGGVSLSYGYDGQGDLTSESGAGASAVTAARQLTYDADGNLSTAATSAGTDSYTYDANGRLTVASGPSGASSYGYNNDGLVNSQTGPGGTTGYTYDPADRLSTLSDPLTGATLKYAYNKDSQPLSITYTSGGTAGPVQSFGYNGLQQLTSNAVTSASGSVLASQAYTYDSNGNLASQVNGGLLGSSAASYAYDKAGRLCASEVGTATLTCASTGSGITSYAYDGDGNLKQAGSTTYIYDPQDQVTSATTSSGTTTYSYALNGALSSVTPAGGSAQPYTTDAYGDVVSGAGGVSYGYDALGRLVSRSTGSSSKSLSYLGTTSTLSSDGASSYTYDPSGSVVAAQASGGGGAYATMSDQHGDLTALFGVTSSTSGLAGSASYGAYGTVTESGLMPQVGYQGDYTDPSTGLVMMGARWYNPATGSFTTNDTIAGSPLPTTVDGNPYAYTSGNPLSQTDPTGHSVSPCEPATCDPVSSPPYEVPSTGDFPPEMVGPQDDTPWGLLFSVGFALGYYGAEAYQCLTGACSDAASSLGSQIGGIVAGAMPSYGYNPMQSPIWNPAPGACYGLCGAKWNSPTSGPVPCTPITCPPPQPPCSVAPASCNIGSPGKTITQTKHITHKVKQAKSYKDACKTGGCANNGQVGNGSTADGNTPVTVSTGDNNGSGVTVTQDQTPQAEAAGAGAGNMKGGGSCGPSSPSGNGGSASPTKGNIGTQRLVRELIAKGYEIRGTEISAEAANGVNVRFDVVAQKDGVIHVYDAKNGPRAMFTKPQGRNGGYQSIEDSGGKFWGPNAEAAGLIGTPLGPTPVEIQGYGGYPWTGLCR